jgi:predicted nucleic acid-binding protein
MKKLYLLDTSVLSGFLSKEKKYLKEMEKYEDGNWAISAITEFELFLYKEKYSLSSKFFLNFLDSFIVLPLERDVFDTAAGLFKKRNHPKPHLADLLIVATSIVNKTPLITGDKGMQKYKHAEVVVLD